VTPNVTHVHFTMLSWQVVTPLRKFLNISKFSPRHDTHYFTWPASPRIPTHSVTSSSVERHIACHGVNRLSCQSRGLLNAHNNTEYYDLHSTHKNATLFILLQFLQSLTDFYIIWPTVYWIRLICNTGVIHLPASLTYCCYTTLGKQVDCTVISLGTKVTHYHCTK